MKALLLPVMSPEMCGEWCLLCVQHDFCNNHFLNQSDWRKDPGPRIVYFKTSDFNQFFNFLTFFVIRVKSLTTSQDSHFLAHITYNDTTRYVPWQQTKVVSAGRSGGPGYRGCWFYVLSQTARKSQNHSRGIPQSTGTVTCLMLRAYIIPETGMCGCENSATTRASVYDQWGHASGQRGEFTPLSVWEGWKG